MLLIVIKIRIQLIYAHLLPCWHLFWKFIHF